MPYKYNLVDKNKGISTEINHLGIGNDFLTLNIVPIPYGVNQFILFINVYIMMA